MGVRCVGSSHLLDYLWLFPKGTDCPPELYKDLDEAAKGKDVWDRLQLRIEFGRRILRWYEENNIEWK